MERVQGTSAQGFPTKALPRQAAHAAKARHAIVHILIRNKGKILVQKRSEQKDVYPGWYEASLSGHLQPGESADAAAIRELREELGLKARPAQLRLLGEFVVDGEETAYVIAYSLRLARTPKLSRELSQLIWLDPQRALKLGLTPASAKAIELAKLGE